MTALDERPVLRWVAHVDIHRLIPAIGKRDEPLIERCPETCDEVRQRIVEVLVFAPPKPVPRHDDAGPESVVRRVEARQRIAIRRCQQTRQHGVSMIVEALRERVPVEVVDAGRHRQSIQGTATLLPRAFRVLRSNPRGRRGSH
jgi:hypothetical protein